MAPLRTTILPLILLSWSAPASAVTVAIARPLDASTVITETLVRLHGELLSVGLEPEIFEAPTVGGLGSTALRAWLEASALERGVDAVVAIVGDAAPVAVEVWVLDKATRTFAISTVPFEPNAVSPAERLAIRAIEVLRSSFLEIDLAARGRRGESLPRPPTALVPLAEVNQPALAHPERFGLQVGAAAVTSLNGVGTAIVPMARFDWAVRPWLVLQAALAGMGTRATVATPAGKALVAQEHGILGGSYRFRSDQRLRPFVALSAGVLRTSIEGWAASPNQGHAMQRWSFLLEASLGTSLRLGDRFYATMATHAQMAEPHVAIHFVDTVVATIARPNLMLTLAVGAWL